MKNLKLISSIIILGLALSNCSQKSTYLGTGNTSTLASSNVKSLNPETLNPVNPLEAYLRRTSGVSVNGTGANATILVRGVNSINANTGPLFVLNGQDIGRDYGRAVNLVRGMNIQSLAVLKGSDATIFGTRGSGGVIVIKAQ